VKRSEGRGKHCSLLLRNRVSRFPQFRMGQIRHIIIIIIIIIIIVVVVVVVVVVIALQPFAGHWRIFQFLEPLHSR
jgi:hypothetical protein